MPDHKHDPWTEVTTRHGLPADQVISALQKEIRRGREENAVLLAYEMAVTGPALEDYLWQRLMVISVEDIGFGEPSAPVLVNALRQMVGSLHRDVAERKLLAVHAARYLCRCLKDRSSDEMLNWVEHAMESGVALPQIPDYALDMHTKAGREMGRRKRHFLEEGAQVSPELPDRDATYRQRLMDMLAAEGDL
jgi:replication-associated recombination protein RarA